MYKYNWMNFWNIFQFYISYYYMTLCYQIVCPHSLWHNVMEKTVERILETVARPLTLRLSQCWKNNLDFSPNKQKKMNPCTQNWQDTGNFLIILLLLKLNFSTGLLDALLFCRPPNMKIFISVQPCNFHVYFHWFLLVWIPLASLEISKRKPL